MLSSIFRDHLPSLRPLFSIYKQSSLEELDLTRPSKVPWTAYYKCKNKECDELPLDHLERCVRYIPVTRRLDVEHLEGAVLTCAKPTDRLPPLVCARLYFDYSANSNFIINRMSKTVIRLNRPNLNTSILRRTWILCVLTVVTKRASDVVREMYRSSSVQLMVSPTRYVFLLLQISTVVLIFNLIGSRH